MQALTIPIQLMITVNHKNVNPWSLIQQKTSIIKLLNGILNDWMIDCCLLSRRRFFFSLMWRRMRHATKDLKCKLMIGAHCLWIVHVPHSLWDEASVFMVYKDRASVHVFSYSRNGSRILTVIITVVASIYYNSFFKYYLHNRARKQFPGVTSDDKTLLGVRSFGLNLREGTTS